MQSTEYKNRKGDSPHARLVVNLKRRGFELICGFLKGDLHKVKTLLMEDANKAYCSPSLYEEYARKIANVEYSTCCLNEVQFNNLVFMGTNATVWDNNQELVNKLTPKSEPRTLKVVAERILTEYPYDLPIQIFKHLSKDEPWFEGCFIVSARFDCRLLGELKVRPLVSKEKDLSPAGSFYLEDGNHRALVYAVFLRLDKKTEYKPVRAVCCKDWQHIYPWRTIPS